MFYVLVLSVENVYLERVLKSSQAQYLLFIHVDRMKFSANRSAQKC